MRVLVLGAGASLHAGYPGAVDLFTTLKRDAEESHAIHLKDAWDRWTQAVDTAPDEIKVLLAAPNPEIVLSMLDLCEMFVSDNFEKVFPRENRSEVVSQSLSSGEIDPRMFASRAHAWLDAAGIAKNRLVLSLSEYFLFKHDEDREWPDRRDYLRELLRPLAAGDVVLTLNWDTTIERTLLEMGRWSPLDGYGFIKRLRIAKNSEMIGLFHVGSSHLPRFKY